MSAANLGLDWSPDPELWAALSQAESNGDELHAWLGLLCGRDSGAEGATALVQKGSSVEAVGAWIRPGAALLDPVEFAERAIRDRQDVIVWRAASPNGTGVRYIIAHPVFVTAGPAAAIVVQLSGRPDRDLGPFIRDLTWSAAKVESLLWRDCANLAKRRVDLASAALEIVGSLGECQGFAETCSVAVSRIASAAGASCAWLGVARRGRVRLAASSLSPLVERRDASTDQVENAMDEAYDQNSSVAYPPSTGDEKFVSRIHNEVAQGRRLAGLASIPLRDGQGACFGVITVERTHGVSFTSEDLRYLELLCSLVSPLLQSRRRAIHIGTASRLVPRLLSSWWIMALLFVSVSLIVLSVVDAEHRVSGKAVLKGIVHQAAVAPFDGFIKEASARAGDTVRAGQTLAKLDDRDLLLDRSKWMHELGKLNQQLRETLAKHDRAGSVVFSLRIRQAEAELHMAEEKLRRLEIKAPLSGTIVSGDLTEQLGAPIEKGKVLFEIAPPDDYRAVVKVDERELGRISVGQAGHLSLAAAPREPIPVTVAKITPVAEQQDGRNVFRVEATLDRSTHVLKPGMEGVAKIAVGRKSLLAVWLDPVLDWAHIVRWRLAP